MSELTVIVPITEYDIEQVLKPIVETNGYVTWTFETTTGETIDVIIQAEENENVSN